MQLFGIVQFGAGCIDAYLEIPESLKESDQEYRISKDMQLVDISWRTTKIEMIRIIDVLARSFQLPAGYANPRYLWVVRKGRDLSNLPRGLRVLTNV